MKVLRVSTSACGKGGVIAFVQHYGRPAVIHNHGYLLCNEVAVHHRTGKAGMPTVVVVVLYSRCVADLATETTISGSQSVTIFQVTALAAAPGVTSGGSRSPVCRLL